MTDRASAAQAYPGLSHFVDGAWLAMEDRPTIDVIDPSTEARIGALPTANEADVGRAIDASQRGFARWRSTPAIDRSRTIRRAAEWLRGQREHWASLIALELGKPLAQARLEVDTACELFEWAAEECRRSYDRQIPSRAMGLRMVAVSDPVGPVGAISGWNAPAVTPARKIAGALAAGCSIVIKPSEATPASALMIARAFEIADLPPGVLNILFGDPPFIGRRLATDPAIKLLTFTGGTAVGKELAALCAGTVKRMVLELGGHAPALVFDADDIDALAETAAFAKFRNAGQICTSPTRFLVKADVFDRFSERFVETARAIRTGDPFDPATQMGPLQNSRRVAAISSLVADAEQRGATAYRGSATAGPGFWAAPSVLTGVPGAARVRHEEPFGPLAILTPFATADEALAEANRMDFGLAAYAFTNDLRLAERLGRDVEAGSLAINHWTASFPESPFGGVKESGFGIEGGSEGLAAFRQTRFLSVATC